MVQLFVLSFITLAILLPVQARLYAPADPRKR